MKTKIYLFVIAMVFLLSGNLFGQDVDGRVTYHNDSTLPLTNVLVKLVDTTDVLLDSCMTNENGYFEFYNVPEGIYYLECETDMTPGGIGLNDSYLILLYLLNLYTLDQIQFLAADVNGDGNVTWNDYWRIVVGWFIYGYPFPAGDWVFEDYMVTVDPQAKPLDEGPGGSSTGDVDGSFAPGSKPEPGLEIFVNENIVADAGKTIEIPVYINWSHPIGGLALSLDYPSDMFAFEGLKTDLKNINYEIVNGKIKVSWLDTKFSNQSFSLNEPVFYIVGTTSNNFVNNNEIVFTTDIQSHMIDSKGYQIDGLTLFMPKYTGESVGLEIGSIYPNPMSENASLDYSLNNDASVKISVFNLLGSEIAVLFDKKQEAGYYNLNFNRSDYNLEAGVYFLILETVNKTKSINTIRFVISD